MAAVEGPEEGELETPQDELNESELIIPEFWTDSDSIYLFYEKGFSVRMSYSVR